MDRPLLFEIEMKKLVRVEDMYKDGTTFHKTIFKGNGSASPYSDFYVLCKYIIIPLSSEIVIDIGL